MRFRSRNVSNEIAFTTTWSGRYRPEIEGAGNMIEEIIYTSAQKGLKAGSRGFCTVVSTAGMALNTAERLESMSGYRHAFPMQDPRAQHNPVNYSHVTLRIGGKIAHVISRVSDAGQDYSGRTNKLAHHLMLDDVSRFVAGPARLMAENGVLVTQWDGNVGNVPPRNLPAPAMPKSLELTAWKSATGDSGWAGWVAEQLMKDKAPVSVIFAAGTETLTLVREALDLLPPTQRWSVTFSTYFTKLLAGTECQLRFVLDDTPEATALRNDARAKVVDLTKSLPVAVGGAMVAQAKSGRVQSGNTDIPEPRIPNRSQPQVQVDPLRHVVPVLAPNEESQGSGSLPEIPMLSPRAPAIPFGSRSGPPELSNQSIRKGGWRTFVLYAAGSLLLMVIASGVTFFVVTKLNSNAPAQVETPSVTSNDAPDAKRDNRFDIRTLPENRKSLGGQQDVTEVKEPPPPVVDAIDKRVPNTSTPSSTTSSDAPSIVQQPKPPNTMAEAPSSTHKTEPDSIDPFLLARKSQNASGTLVFETPKTDSRDSTSFPLIVRNVDSVQVECVKSFLTHVKNTNQVSIDYQKKDSAAEWTVKVGQEVSDKELWTPVGTLSLKELENTGNAIGERSHILEFSWLPNSQNNPEVEFVRWCPLRISVDGIVAGVLLHPPVVTAAIDARQLLGNSQNGTYLFKSNGRDFPGMSASQIDGLRVDMAIRLPNKDNPGISFSVQNRSAVLIRLLAQPPLTECKDRVDIPHDTKLVTDFTFTWASDSAMDTTITAKQEARLRALGMPRVQINSLRTVEFPKQISDFTYLNENKGKELADKMRPFVELKDFDSWYRFEPKNLSEMRDHARDTRKGVEGFLKGSEAARSVIPAPVKDESPNPLYDLARAKYEKMFNELQPLVVELQKQASEDAVKAYEMEFETMREWLKECKVTASVSATFEVDGADPITVTFLQTDEPTKGAVE